MPITLPGAFVNDTHDMWSAAETPEAQRMLAHIEAAPAVRAGRTGWYVKVELTEEELVWLRTEAWWRWEMASGDGDAELRAELSTVRNAALTVMHRIDAELGRVPGGSARASATPSGTPPSPPRCCAPRGRADAAGGVGGRGDVGGCGCGRWGAGAGCIAPRSS